jgi:tRNA dimethylallyltransferase
MSQAPLLVIAGPTAVGKSALALAVARRAPGEIIVADSMQVYQGMDVGTGKPTAEQRHAVPHHLLDICRPEERFSAAEFATRALTLVNCIRSRGRLPILAGGTGLYLRAFLRGRLEGAAGDPAVRACLAREAERVGVRELHERLRAADPATAARIHPKDLVRIVRALEILEITGRLPSEIRPGLWRSSGYRPPVLILTRTREELNALINDRSRRMWEGGLIAEVRGLLASGIQPEVRALQSLGYRQAVAYLTGRLAEAEALASMQRATRNYAKRQLTWFRQEPGAEWIMVRGWDWVEPLAENIVARLSRERASIPYRMTSTQGAPE